MMTKRMLMMVLLSLGAFSLMAQAKIYSDKYLSKHPVWIQMIDKEETNYFEAVKAFDLYWKNRELPVEEEEVLDSKFQKEREEEEKGFFYRIFHREEAEAKKYVFEYKKFKHWQRLVEPYVQEDGRILTKAEQLKIFEAEKKRAKL